MKNRIHGPAHLETGVTLLELLITIAIIFILAAIAMPITKITGKRTKEIELRQNLRIIRTAIDQYNQDWNRNGAQLIGVECVKNKLTCLDEGINSADGHPKTLETLLKVELSGLEATAKNLKTKRYLRRIPIDPMTNSQDWGLRCYTDDIDSNSWCGDDVYDVYTKSEGVATDGTKYSDW